MIGPVSSLPGAGFLEVSGRSEPTRPALAEPKAAEAQEVEGKEKELDRLWEASKQMEGVFVQYLMKALRDTVPNQGHADAPGADMYGSLLDEHMAQVIANETHSGIAEALYRQLASIAAASSEGGTER